jgi:hypothetical protein
VKIDAGVMLSHNCSYSKLQLPSFEVEQSRLSERLSSISPRGMDAKMGHYSSRFQRNPAWRHLSRIASANESIPSQVKSHHHACQDDSSIHAVTRSTARYAVCMRVAFPCRRGCPSACAGCTTEGEPNVESDDCRLWRDTRHLDSSIVGVKGPACMSAQEEVHTCRGGPVSMAARCRQIGMAVRIADVGMSGILRAKLSVE